MSQPDATTSDVLSEANTPAVPTDSSGIRSVVDLRIVRALIQEFSHPADVTNAQSTITRTALDSLSAQIAKSAFQISAASLTAEIRDEAVTEHPRTGEVPAIIVRRSIGEAISRGDLVSGQKLPGTELYLVTAWEPTNRKGERLGRNIASFTSLENLPGDPSTFNRNIVKISQLKSWHGHDGWEFDRHRSGTPSYEDARFKSYQDKSGFGLWSAPELPLINGEDRNEKPVSPNENMLLLSNNETLSNGATNLLYNTFVTIGGSHYLEWSQACTELTNGSGTVHTVHFPEGTVGWEPKAFFCRSCVRPVVPLELSRLIH